MTTTQPAELVVLLDNDAKPIGSADKLTVHSLDTPLHLAFSCHLFNDSGEVLLTRRALTKRTWPGVWTNSFCGHPAPGEAMADAVRRRAQAELGIAVSNLELALPDFQYRAVDASGIVENEVCPVYRAHIVGSLDPSPDEVMEYQWVAPDLLRAAVAATPFAFSPWIVLQLDAWGY